jgi:hypothetical protein
MNRYDENMRSLAERYQEEVQVDQVTDEDLDEAERIIGATFPWDYREFLRDYGWSSVNNSFPLSDGGLGYLGYFWGIDNGSNGLEKNFKSYLNSRPSHLLEIGSGDSGELFLSLHNDDKGNIYYYDRYEAVGDGLEENLVFVAESFDDFLRILTAYGSKTNL